MDPVTTDIVILTAHHLIRGQVQLRDRRLSDLLNDPRESSIYLTQTVMERIDESGRPIAAHTTAVIPKDRIIAAFEAVRETTPNSRRLYARVKKQTHCVFVLAHGLEIRGTLHSTTRLDAVGLKELAANPTGKFLPTTDAVVALWHARSEIIHQAALLVNVDYIEYIAPDGNPPQA